jgi:hypothetical protein
MLPQQRGCVRSMLSLLDMHGQLCLTHMLRVLCLPCRRRKGSISLLPSDMKEYLQRAWQVAVPGPGSNPNMVPYKRASASSVHATRLANIKESLAKAGEGGAAGGGAAGRQ